MCCPSELTAFAPPAPNRSSIEDKAVAEECGKGDTGGAGQEEEDCGACASHRVHTGAEALVHGPPPSRHEDSGATPDEVDPTQADHDRAADAGAHLPGAVEAAGQWRHDGLRVARRREDGAGANERDEDLQAVQVHLWEADIAGSDLALAHLGAATGEE